MGGHHHHATGSTKNIKTAFFLNLFFAVVELVGGFYTNSVAILSDALHDLGDCLSLGVAWYFQKLSGRSIDRKYTYGYKRFSILGAIINAVVLTAGSVFIFVEAIPRLFDPVMPDAQGMIVLSVGGIIVNGIAAIRLKKGSSINEKVVYLHLMEDLLGWVATLIVSVILLFRTIPILDPVLSLAIAGYILFNVVKNIRKSIKIILQATPENIDPSEVESVILKHDKVQDVHDCHIWTLDGEYNVLSIHVVLSSDLKISSIASLKENIKRDISQLGINHATLEFEEEGEHCNIS